MLRLRQLSLLVAVVIFVQTSVISPRSFAEVPKKQLKELESVFLPAWNQGNNLMILKSLSKVVRKMSPEQIVELDEMLALQQIPNSGHVLVVARMHLMRQGRKKDVPRPGISELILTLESLDSEFESVFADADDLYKRLANEVNEVDKASFDDYEDLLWDNHVLEQKLIASISLAQYAAYMCKRNKKRFKNKLDEDQADLFDTDYEKVATELAAKRKDISEHEILVRMKRLEFANHVLRSESPLKDRYLATWALETDSRIVIETLSNTGRKFNSPLLNEPDVTEQIQTQVKTGVDQAGAKLIKKSGLLFTGLHWWKRGRYGMGSEAFGFMKSEWAVTSDAALFPLYMPEETPVPTSYSSEEVVPEIDRRHKYIWEWEYRRVTASKSETSASKRSSKVTTVTQLSRFY